MSCSDSFLAYFASFLFFESNHHRLFGRFSDLVRIVSVDKSASARLVSCSDRFLAYFASFLFFDQPPPRAVRTVFYTHSCFRPASGTLSAGQWSFWKVLARYSDRFCCTQKNILKILVFVLLTKSWARAKKYLQYIPSLCYVHTYRALLYLHTWLT